MRRVIFILFYSSPNEQRARGGGGGGAARLFFFFFPVQQTTSGIGHRVKYFFRVGNQYAECEKQQQTATMMVYYIVSVLFLLFFWCPCVAINVSIQYNGGLSPEIILSTQYSGGCGLR